MKSSVTKNGHHLFQVLSGRSNVFIVSNGQEFLLIDTGRKNERSILFDRIDQFRAEGLVPAGLILTHAHFDHVENAAAIKSRYEIPVFIQQEEAEYLGQGKNPPIQGTFFFARFLTDSLYAFERKRRPVNTYEPTACDYRVTDLLDLHFLGFNAYLLHTPGHTSGSMSVIIDEEIAVVGDAMFGIFKDSVFPPFAVDPDLLVKSWGKLLDTGCSVFLPAHGTARSRWLLEKQYNKHCS